MSVNKKNQNFSQQPNNISSLKFQASSFTGILPPPDILIHYNEAVPDAAERIIKMAEKQQDHRIELEKKAIRGQIIQSQTGQIMAGVLGLCGICGGIFLLFNDKDIGGFTALIGTISALVGVFLKSQKNQRENLKSKNPE
jgi:uncharacterized membrane protein